MMRRTLLTGIWLGLLALLASFSLQDTGTHSLSVTIHNIRSAEGTVEIALYNDADAFPSKDKAFRGVVVYAKEGALVYTFKDVPAGTYAVAVIHDENRNKKLDTNFMGIPTEGFGFSNDAMGTFGAPGFEAASIKLDRDMEVGLKLRHF